jgi:hypothetical protein
MLCLVSLNLLFWTELHIFAIDLKVLRTLYLLAHYITCKQEVTRYQANPLLQYTTYVTISIRKTSSHKHVSSLRPKKRNLNRLTVKIHMFLTLKRS